MMLRLVKIKRDGKDLSQSFLTGSAQSASEIEFSSTDIIKDDEISLIARINVGQQVIKLVKPRTWHERPKLYWGRSSFNKEINGNRLLSQYGIRVPQIYQTGLGLLPGREYQYLGYYVMENLEKKGLKEAASVYMAGELSGDARRNMFSSIVRDLSTMRYHRLLYSDLRLRNIFSNTEGSITWIDTGVTPYSMIRRKPYQRKFERSVRKMLKPYIKDMTDEEISRFENLLLGKN